MLLEVVMNYVLMCKDKVVGVISNDGSWAGDHVELLPKNFNPDEGVRPMTLESDGNLGKFIAWCAGRTLSIDRVNAKKILNALRLTQSQSPVEKAKVALAYRCLSLIDSYWVRLGLTDDGKWEDVDLRNNTLNNSLALIALKGTSMTIQAKHGLTAEVTTLGSYAKGWFRVGNDKLPYLYKAIGGEGNEVEREVCASNIIDCFNRYGNVKYETAVMEGVRCSKCAVMTNENKGIVHAADFNVWCIANGTNAVDYARLHYRKEFSQMMVIDYLIANSDRHGYNWGFWHDMNTGEILGLHDLYDHNNAFARDYLNDEKLESIVMGPSTMKECAIGLFKFSGLVNTKKITGKMFPYPEAYEVFVKRCTQVGLPLI
jgi:hypothetical protein